MKKIIVIILLIFVSGITAQEFASKELVKGLYDFSLFPKTLIPKFRPFATSSYMADSTNYWTIVGDGLCVYDSVRIGGDLFVGFDGGTIYLDTNRNGSIYYSGYNLNLFNNKTNGGQIYYIG